MNRDMTEITFELAQEMLDEIAADLPREIFRGLNGGYVLSPEELFDANGLVILGHYHHQPHGLGRYISVYYGSIFHLYGHLPTRRFREKLKYVLHHELTHHLESLAGDKSLEIQDEIDKARFLGYNP
jgi:hypothetical protein